MVSYCLAAFKYAIRICCQFDMELERNGFISMLSKYTILGAAPVKNKNLEAIKILLEIGLTEGNFLKTSWIDVLRCISFLDKYQVLAADGVEDGGFASAQSQEDKRKKGTKKKGLGKGDSSTVIFDILFL